MNCRDPNTDSECDATVGCCRGFVQAPHVVDSPLVWRCIQIIHAVDDFRFQWAPLGTDSGIGNVEVLQKRQRQDCVAHDVTVVHVPLICQASVFLQPVPHVTSTSELFRSTKLEICRFLQPGRVVGRGFDVSTLLLPCAWEETRTPLRALLSTRSFRGNFSSTLILASGPLSKPAIHSSWRSW